MMQHVKFANLERAGPVLSINLNKFGHLTVDVIP